MSKEVNINDTPIFSKLKDIVCEDLCLDNMKELNPDLRLVEDIGCDDLDTIELVMSVEEVFGIPIPDEDADKFTTLRDIYNYLVAKGVK